METNQGPEVHTETDAARAGSTPHVVRWILLVSLIAAIVLLSIIWMTGAATQGDAEENVEVSNDIQGQSGSTGSILSDNADEFETAEPGQPADLGVRTIEN